MLYKSDKVSCSKAILLNCEDIGQNKKSFILANSRCINLIFNLNTFGKFMIQVKFVNITLSNTVQFTYIYFQLISLKHQVLTQDINIILIICISNNVFYLNTNLLMVLRYSGSLLRCIIFGSRGFLKLNSMVPSCCG